MFKILPGISPSFIAGALDAGVFIIYLAGWEPTAGYYLVCIAVKFALVVVWGRREIVNIIEKCALFFILVFSAELFSQIVNDQSWATLLRVTAFLLNLLLSLALMKGDYWNAVFLVGALNCALYLLYAQLGKIGVIWGRYQYYNLTHPNLGSEIFMASAFSSIMIQPRLYHFVINIGFLGASILLQGRSAIVSIASVIVIQFYKYVFMGSGISKKWVGIVFVFMVALCAVLGLVFSEKLSAALSTALQLDNPYRGISSGGSGRSEHWNTAIQMFLTNIFFGAGLDYAENLSVPQAHNFFLYGMACYGLVGIVILFAVLSYMWDAVRVWGVAYIVPFIPMLVYNDRFINLNVYPFILYVFILDAHVRRCALSRKSLTAKKANKLKLRMQPRNLKGDGGVANV